MNCCSRKTNEVDKYGKLFKQIKSKVQYEVEYIKYIKK